MAKHGPSSVEHPQQRTGDDLSAMVCLGPAGSNNPLTPPVPAGGWRDVQDSGAVAEALVWETGGSAAPTGSRRSPREAPGRLPDLGTPLGKAGQAP